VKVARGGVGMSTVAYLAVSPDGRPNASTLYMRDEVIPGLRKLTDAIHAEGAKAAVQIGHAGLVADQKSNGLKSLGGLASETRDNPEKLVGRRAAQCRQARTSVSKSCTGMSVADMSGDGGLEQRVQSIVTRCDLDRV